MQIVSSRADKAIVLLAVAIALGNNRSFGADCNGNGIDDSQEALIRLDDYDYDYDVDADDFAALAANLAGPGQPVPDTQCATMLLGAFDADTDGDLDALDFARFQREFGTPGCVAPTYSLYQDFIGHDANGVPTIDWTDGNGAAVSSWNLEFANDWSQYLTAMVFTAPDYPSRLGKIEAVLIGAGGLSIPSLTTFYVPVFKSYADLDTSQSMGAGTYAFMCFQSSDVQLVEHGAHASGTTTYLLTADVNDSVCDSVVNLEPGADYFIGIYTKTYWDSGYMGVMASSAPDTLSFQWRKINPDDWVRLSEMLGPTTPAAAYAIYLQQTGCCEVGSCPCLDQPQPAWCPMEDAFPGG